MADKFRNTYRSPSARLQSWDYGADAWYFITICTQNRVHHFGNIHDGAMVLSDVGTIADAHWLYIPQQFPYVVLHNHVVMPNHVHGIIEIAKGNDNGGCDGNGRDAINRVPTKITMKNTNPDNHITHPNEKIGGFANHKNPMLNENISRIIRWYKGVVTFQSRKIQSDFSWQPRFYDHIIRNRQSLDTIQSYIINNPLNWNEDKFYKEI